MTSEFNIGKIVKYLDKDKHDLPTLISSQQSK